MKDSFVFYKSWQKSLNRLSTGDSFKKVFNALCNFAFEQKEIDEQDFSNEELIIIDMSLPLLQASIANYNNGLKGGRPNKINETKAIELKNAGLSNSEIAEFFNVSKRAIEIFFQERKNEKTTEKTTEKTPKKRNDNVNLNETYNDTLNETYNETENLNNNVNSKDIHKENSHFKKPTLKQICDFCEKKNLGLNPEEFFNYYESVNWQNVYNWQALIVAWNNRQIATYNKTSPKNSLDPYADLRG